MSESGSDIGNGTGVVGEPIGPELRMWENQQDRNWGCGRSNRTGTGDVEEPIGPELGMWENQ